MRRLLKYKKVLLYSVLCIFGIWIIHWILNKTHVFDNIEQLNPDPAILMMLMNQQR